MTDTQTDHPTDAHVPTEAELAELSKWHWEPQPEAQKLVDELLADFLSKCPKAGELAHRMQAETATRFNDWIDTIFVASSKPGITERLGAVGYVPFETELASDVAACYHNPKGLFPAIALLEEHIPAAKINVGIKVESVADFFAAHNLRITDDNVGGLPGERSRWGMAFHATDAQLWAIE
ncbi:MAG: hypothetical protein AAF747_02660, partial [Planctomycetota bacterium]